MSLEELRTRAEGFLEVLDAGGNVSRLQARTFLERFLSELDGTTPERRGQGYRLWVNRERTVLARVWLGSGIAEVATRDDPSDTWGPPTRLLQEPGE